MNHQIISIANQFCRILRKNQTHSEEILWGHLRGRQFLGKKFLRQHPIFFSDSFGNGSFYIADFYCHEHHLVIELDGKSHYYQQEYDQARTFDLSILHITVVRFRNDEVENEVEVVLGKMKKMLSH